jgi:nicotinamidase-related amidase
MPTRRVLRGVLDGFLGTYTSRYSAYRGFWLFGFLVEKLDSLEIDLLAADGIATDHPVRKTARDVAANRFADQLRKSGLKLSNVRNARLTMQRLPDDGSIPGHHFRGGYNIRFLAKVTADTGRQFERERIVFVAPHDPQRELASAYTRK